MNRRHLLMAALGGVSVAAAGSLAWAFERQRQLGLVDVAYGLDADQKLLMTPAREDETGLFVYVHGGAWSMGSLRLVDQKPEVAKALGMGFASFGYRLVPKTNPKGQAEDLAKALAKLLILRPNMRGRVVLCGHSAGAHLVALLALDRSYLKAVGLQAEDVQALILLDGAGYDIPAQFALLKSPKAGLMGRFLLKQYTDAFGEQVEVQRELSPLYRLTPGYYPQVLSIPIRARPDSVEQTGQLLAALKALGARAEAYIAETDSHRDLNVQFGQRDDLETQAAFKFLRDR